MCILKDLLEDLIWGRVTTALKPPGLERQDIWSLRHINSLPREILLLIFRYLNAKELKTAILVCKTWRDVGEDPVIWKHYKLVVTGIEIDTGYLETILAFSRFTSLQHLEVNGYGQNAKMPVNNEIYNSIFNSQLSKLTLKHCDLTELDFDSFSSVLSKLRVLSLWQVQMSAEQVSLMFNVLARGSKLVELDIAYSYLDLQLLQTPTFVKALNKIRTVNLGHTKVTSQQLKSLMEKMSRKTLIRSLDVGYRDLSLISHDVIKAATRKLQGTNICPVKFITTPYLLSNKVTA